MIAPGIRSARAGVAVSALVLLLGLLLAEAERAVAEQASAPTSPAAGRLDVGGDHSCAVADPIRVRCWGFGGDGRLGYGNLETIGDDETPGAVGPVDLGLGRAVTALSSGGFHNCAVLAVDASVLCWGSGGIGQLGYASTESIGDDEFAGAGGSVDLGTGRTARAITAGEAHSCAILDLGEVRCWGHGNAGRLGYVDTADVGDNETPGSLGPVDLGPGRTAVAVSAGSGHTCAILDDGSVRCWGAGGSGQLGYASTSPVGDNESPGSVGPVDLGAGRSARAIAAGGAHTCALLDDASVRCWGSGFLGQLGYGNRQNVGDNEPPGSVDPVDLGPGRTAKAIVAADEHTCALLDDDTVRCWGFTGWGRLGYGRLEFGGLKIVGDNESPGSVGPVELGAGRTATAIAAGGRNTCARLDDGNVRCWGYGGSGELGLCSLEDIGDDEVPASAGPVVLTPPADGGSGCPIAGGTPSTPAQRRAATRASQPVDAVAGALRAERARRRGLVSCRSEAAAHTRREIRSARGRSRAGRARARQHWVRHRSRLRRRCLDRWGRTPGRVTGLTARAVSSTRVVLTFNAAGSDGNSLPAARTYVVKQSRRPIRSRRAFRRAQTLCDGSCRFPTIRRVGGKLSVTVHGLTPGRTYHYAVAARDNVSRRLGPRSAGVRARTP